MKFSGILYEMILREYNEKLLNQLIKRFQEEAPGLDSNIIRIYINRFVQIKNSPNVTEKDITKYTWKQLETVVDSNQPKRIKTGKINDGEPGGDSNLVYNENGLRIYIGKTKNACIKYGNGYSFCISSRGEGNLYFDYRHRRKGTPYFIFDDTKTSEQNDIGKFIDPDHLLVLFVHEPDFSGGLFWYTLTTADNEGDVQYDNFGIIEEKYPRLNGMKELFKPVEVDPKEKFEYEIKIKYRKPLDDIVDEILLNNDIQIPYSTYSSLRNISSANKIIDGLLKENVEIFLITAELKTSLDKVHYKYKIKNNALGPDYFKTGAKINFDLPLEVDEDGNPKDYYPKLTNKLINMFVEKDDHETVSPKQVLNDFNITYKKMDEKSNEIFRKFLNDIKELVDQYRSELSKTKLLSK